MNTPLINYAKSFWRMNFERERPAAFAFLSSLAISALVAANPTTLSFLTFVSFAFFAFIDTPFRNENCLCCVPYAGFKTTINLLSIVPVCGNFELWMMRCAAFVPKGFDQSEWLGSQVPWKGRSPTQSFVKNIGTLSKRVDTYL